MERTQINKRRIQTNSGFKKTSSQAVFFQPKLTINHPDDKYEQEADAIAEKVMRMQSTKNENIFN